MSDVTAEERCAEAIRRGNFWIANLTANAKQAREAGAVDIAKRLEGRASEVREMLKILQGEDDAYIVSLRST